MSTIKNASNAFHTAITRHSQEGTQISTQEAKNIVKGGVKDVAASATPVETLHEAKRFIENSILESDRERMTHYLPSGPTGFTPHTGYEVLRDADVPIRKAATEKLATLAGVPVNEQPVQLTKSIAAKGLAEIKASDNPAKTYDTYSTLLNEAINLRTLPNQNRALWKIRDDFHARAEKLVRS